MTRLKAADKLDVLFRVNMNMEQIHITLPDGSVQEVPKGTTPADIARKISPRLADAALVAHVTATNGAPLPNAPDQGELIDLRRPLS